MEEVMPLGVYSPQVKVRKDPDGTWTAILYIDGQWWAQISGYTSAAEARKDIRTKYFGE